MAEMPVFPISEIPQKWRTVLQHNDVPIVNYPDRDWFLVPFPSGKGEPFNKDNLATVNQSGFRNQSKFKDARLAAYSRWGRGETARNVDWRLHVFLWVAETALLLNPKLNFIELGTGRGFMAAGFFASRASGDKLPNKFFLADKFTRTAATGVSLDDTQGFMYAEGDDDVKKYFSQYSGADVITGQLPQSLKGKSLGGIGFVHVDLNSPSDEVACLELLLKNLAPGTLILFDDSGNPGREESMRVHQKFADFCDAPLLVLPTGQALLSIPA